MQHGSDLVSITKAVLGATEVAHMTYRYYSNVQIQNGTNNAYVPTCIWLDANGDQVSHQVIEKACVG